MPEYRFWISITMTDQQEHQYRAERGVAGATATRPDLAAHIATALEGEGILSGWWGDVRVR